LLPVAAAFWMKTPFFPLPEITLRAPAVAPPMVLFGA
jgi:hypothetical protein